MKERPFLCFQSCLPACVCVLYVVYYLERREKKTFSIVESKEKRHMNHQRLTFTRFNLFMISVE